MPNDRFEDFSWEALLRAAAALQRLIPDATLVGRTAAALFADHIIPDVRARFAELLSLLEQREAWTTARVRKPDGRLPPDSKPAQTSL